MPCARTAPIRSGLRIGIDGTYQSAAGSSSSTPPAAHSTTSMTCALQEPQPLPARVAAMTPRSVRSPRATHARIAPLVTPLQLQICASSGSSATLTSVGGPPRSNSSDTRSSGSTVPRSKACMRNETLRMSPSSVAPDELAVADDHASCRRRAAARRTGRPRRRGARAPTRPIVASSTPETFSLVASFEPWYAACGSRP